MEFLDYRSTRGKLKKRSLLFKRPCLEEVTDQLHLLSRQLNEHKLYSGFCHLAIAQCQYSNRSSAQVGAILNAARSFAQSQNEVVSLEDHIKLVIMIYTKALLICDRSFLRPIRLEMGRFYESHGMHQQAAECFKQSMCISRCVHNLIFAKCYKNALEELKNCPSHLMTTKDHTSLFLLELLLGEDTEDSNRNSLQQLSRDSRASTERGLLPIDDHLYDLAGLLESFLMLQKEHKSSKHDEKNQNISIGRENKIKNLIVNKLSAFLDPAQVQLLCKIASTVN